jgi:hypothetical protein
VSLPPITVFDLALEYINLGWQPIPVPYREKGPTIPNWTNLRITHETAPHYFNGAPQNIGIILGEASKNLVDVDIDCPEALALAPHLLPATPGRFGRPSKRASHWLYVSDVPKHLKFEDPNIDGAGKTIVELRTGGVQTVFPGSHHVSGEYIDFEDGADPAQIPHIERATLEAAVGVLAAACLLARYFPKKGRHDFCLALGGGLLRDGWSAENAELFVGLVAWAGGSDNPRARAATVKGTAEKLAAGEPITSWNRVTELIADRPLGGGVGGKKLVSRARKWLPARKEPTGDRVIIICGFDELEVADQMLPALASLPNVFNRGWKLVQILRDPNKSKDEEPIRREANAPIISEMSRARTRGLISHACAFQRWKTTSSGESTLVSCGVPDDPLTELHCRGEWPGVKFLEGITECPVLRPDGTILDTPGYDRATGLFYEPNVDFPPIPSEPTLDDATTAIATLFDIVQDFPFVSQEHFSAWMALLFTPFARPTIDGCVPFGVLDKNARRVGATYLADIIGEIYSGRSLPRTSKTNEEEMRKRILSLAISGDPIILLDNVEGVLDSSTLAGVITSMAVLDRRLGVTEMVAMPMRALWLVTAQNLILSNELVGRALHVRLETAFEHPEHRTGFKYDPILPHVHRERPKLASAVLTVLRGYFAAGCPDQRLTSWGSFEQWSRIVRGALVWAGMPDPINGRRELVESGDSELGVLERVLIEWEKLGKPMLVSDLLAEMHVGAFAHAALKEALAELCECSPDKLTTKLISMQLRKYKKKNVGGRRFDHKPKQGGGTPWFVSRISW